MSHNRSRPARGFRTDTDISRQKQRTAERELQPWQPDPSSGDADAFLGLADDETFGPGAGKTGPGGGGKGWDQFATNAALFGATTTYSEDLYTTRLDRTKQGYKAREREAERLAREIEGQATSNVHLAEERGQVVPQGEGWDEEDKYSGVQRRAGAYVPPGARAGGKVVGKEGGKDVKDKETSAAANQPATTELASHDSGNPKPFESGNTAKPAAEPLKPSPAKDTLKVSPSKPTASPASAAPADITSTMREFAETERSKIAQAKADMHKTERERRLADLVNFGKTFKVPGTKPKDLQGVLAGPSTNAKKEAKAAAKPAAAVAAAGKPSHPTNGHRPPIASGTPAVKPRISMHIPEIPPFKGARQQQQQQQQQQQPPKLVVPPTANMPVPGIAAPAQSKDGKAPGGGGGLNPAAAAFAFKPNPAASTFQPGNVPVVPASGANGSGPALPPITTKMPSQPIAGIAVPMNGPVLTSHLQQPPIRNPFFINPPRRVPGVNLRDEFNPMKSRRAGRPEDTPMVWQYSGRRVLQGVHHHMHPSGMYNLHMNGVHPNLGPGGPPPHVVGSGIPVPPMLQQPGSAPPHVVPQGMPVPGSSPMAPPAQQQKQGQAPPNGMSPAAGSGMALEDERFSPIPNQPGGVPFQPPPSVGGAGAGAASGGPGMGPAGGFNGYRGPHQPQMQHMGQPGMFAQYPGNGGVFMGNPMLQGMPYNPQMMGNGPMRPVYYPQLGMTSHPTSPMPHALTPQMMSTHPPP